MFDGVMYARGLIVSRVELGLAVGWFTGSWIWDLLNLLACWICWAGVWCCVENLCALVPPCCTVGLLYLLSIYLPVIFTSCTFSSTSIGLVCFLALVPCTVLCSVLRCVTFCVTSCATNTLYYSILTPRTFIPGSRLWLGTT
ncbi:hypothetical protein BDV06DRAFT_19520 [Aspergillus oleicola]